MARTDPFKAVRIGEDVLELLASRKKADGVSGSRNSYIESILKSHAQGHCSDVKALRAKIELELRREIQSELISALKPEGKPAQAARAERITKHGQRKTA